VRGSEQAVSVIQLPKRFLKYLLSDFITLRSLANKGLTEVKRKSHEVRITTLVLYTTKDRQWVQPKIKRKEGLV